MLWLAYGAKILTNAQHQISCFVAFVADVFPICPYFAIYCQVRSSYFLFRTYVALVVLVQLESSFLSIVGIRRS